MKKGFIGRPKSVHWPTPIISHFRCFSYWSRHFKMDSFKGKDCLKILLFYKESLKRWLYLSQFNLGKHTGFKLKNTGIPRLVRFFGPQETALIGDWFNNKIMIWDFWIFKVPFLAHFHTGTLTKTTEIWPDSFDFGTELIETKIKCKYYCSHLLFKICQKEK